jgi:hypothetical protein
MAENPVPRMLALVGGSPSACPVAALSPTVRRPCSVGRLLTEDGDQKQPPPVLPEETAEGSHDVRTSALPEPKHDAYDGVQRISKAELRTFRRNDGGNVIASDSMWLFGCVQPAVAELRLVTAIRRRSRQEELVIGRGELRFASAVSGFTGSPVLRGEHAGTPSAWRHASGAGCPRRFLALPAGPRSNAADADGISRDPGGACTTSALHCDVRPKQQSL